MEKSPICGDVYAKLFMDGDGRHIYDEFKEQVCSSASILIRHRIIDDVLRNMLVSNPDLCVVTIGAGFDSRPYRLAGGIWFELDEPLVMAYKNVRLPASECANPLRRIPIDFCTDSMEEKLSAVSSAVDHAGEIVFILEGVFIYLNQNETEKTLKALSRLFPKHQLICDLVTREMVDGYGKKLQEIAAKMGAPFKAIDKPESIFLTSGYNVKNKISIVEMSVDLGINKIPKFIWKYYFNREIKGNSVYVLENAPP